MRHGHFESGDLTWCTREVSRKQASGRESVKTSPCALLSIACPTLPSPEMPAAVPVRRAAAFFDLDKTVIAKSSTLAFCRPFYRGGLINRRAVLRSAYAQFVYLAGGADEDQMERMRQYLSDVRRLGRQAGAEIVAETLHELIDPLIYDEAAT